MATSDLSDCALELLRYHFSGLSLRTGASNPETLPGHTLEATQAAYSELEAEGLMKLVDMSRDGESPRYWLTLGAIERKSEWLIAAHSSRPSPPKESAVSAG
jgi:hypothetical protein